MKLLLIYIGLLLSVAVTDVYANAMTSNSNKAGILYVGMKVSVTVLESSQITDVQPMVSGIPSRGSKKLYNESPGVGSVSFVSSPQKELLISISGNRALTDGNGGSIIFSPEVLIGSNDKSLHILSSGGAAVSVIYTGSGYGGYRGNTTLQLFGTLDAGEHTTGHFSTVYTVTVEHQ